MPKLSFKGRIAAAQLIPMAMLLALGLVAWRGLSRIVASHAEVD